MMEEQVETHRCNQEEIEKAEAEAKESLMGLILTAVSTGLVPNATKKTTEFRGKIFMAFDISELVSQGVGQTLGNRIDAPPRETDTREAVAAYRQRCIDEGHRPATLDIQQRLLHPFVEEFPILPMTEAPLRGFISRSSKNQNTRWAYGKTIKAFYRWLWKEWRITAPMPEIKPPSQTKGPVDVLPEDKLIELFQLSKSPRDEALVNLVLETGLRRGELANLSREDIGERTLKVRGKTGEDTVAISQELRGELLVLVSSGPLFRGPKGPLTGSGIRQVFVDLFKKVGWTGAQGKHGPHLLRHTFATMALRQGMNQLDLKRTLRHTSLAMTDRYVHHNEADLIALQERHSPRRALLAKLNNPGKLGAGEKQ